MKINFNAEISREQFDILLNEYRSFAAPALSLLAAILLFLFVLLPQIFSFSSKKSVADSENHKLTDLKNAQNIATSADVVALSSNLSLSSGVLPSEKDFRAVLNDISEASNDSGVTVKGYQFANTVSTTNLGNYPSVVFSVDLNATPRQVMGFINSLYKRAPVSEVSHFSGDGSSASLTVGFYYKPFSPSSEAANISVRKMSQPESNILNAISGWGVSSGIEANNLPQSTESADVSGSPF